MHLFLAQVIYISKNVFQDIFVKYVNKNVYHESVFLYQRKLSLVEMSFIL